MLPVLDAARSVSWHVLLIGLALIGIAQALIWQTGTDWAGSVLLQLIIIILATEAMRRDR
jgi:uncharacterized membrane protein SirB2